MSKQMNWRRAALHGKPVLDHRYEFDPDYPDRAARWLRAVENRQRERRGLAAPFVGGRYAVLKMTMTRREDDQ